MVVDVVAVERQFCHCHRTARNARPRRSLRFKLVAQVAQGWLTGYPDHGGGAEIPGDDSVCESTKKAINSMWRR